MSEQTQRGRTGWIHLRQRYWRAVAALIVGAAIVRVSVPAADVSPCPGDCNGDAAVTVDELAIVDQIALQNVSVSTCPAGDQDGDTVISIDEIKAATDAALGACAVPPASLPLPSATSISIGTATGSQGTRGNFDVTLHAMGATLIGVETYLGFDAEAPIADDGNGQPACVVNAAIDKVLRLSFTPPGCTPGEDCTGVLAIVHPLVDDPIPDGAVLFTCTVQFSGAACGDRPILCGGAMGASAPPVITPVGVGCTDGTARTVPPETACVGDCSGNGQVSIGEVVRAVSLFLGQPLCNTQNPSLSCPVADANHNGSVSVGEVVQGVNRFLTSCPPVEPPVALDDFDAVVSNALPPIGALSALRTRAIDDVHVHRPRSGERDFTASERTTIAEVVAAHHPTALRLTNATIKHDAHGKLFDQRRSWIDNGRVQEVLGTYVPVAPPAQIGDLVLYKKDGVIAHSGRVMRLNQDGGVAEVQSKWGSAGEYSHALEDVPALYGTPMLMRQSPPPVVACDETVFTEAQISAAALTAMSNLSDPWDADFPLLLDRVGAELGCVVGNPTSLPALLVQPLTVPQGILTCGPDCHRSCIISSFCRAGEGCYYIASEDGGTCAPLSCDVNTMCTSDTDCPAGQSCVEVLVRGESSGRCYNPCCNYCGPGANRCVSVPNPTVVGCLNQACFKHDACYGGTCVAGGCHFSSQGSVDDCDGALLAAVRLCRQQGWSGPSAIVAALIQDLKLNRRRCAADQVWYPHAGCSIVGVPILGNAPLYQQVRWASGSLAAVAVRLRAVDPSASDTLTLDVKVKDGAVFKTVRQVSKLVKRPTNVSTDFSFWEVFTMPDIAWAPDSDTEPLILQIGLSANNNSFEWMRSVAVGDCDYNGGQGFIAGSADVPIDFLFKTYGVPSFPDGTTLPIEPNPFSVVCVPPECDQSACRRGVCGTGGCTDMTCGLSIEPSALEFSTVAGTCAADQSFTIQNPVECPDFTGTVTPPIGPGLPTVIAGGSFDIAAGESHSVVVRICPPTSGSTTSPLTFSTSRGRVQRSVSGVAVACNNNNQREGIEQCDGTDHVACGAQPCLPDCKCPVCGNNVREGTEQCDGSASPACPGLCIPAGQPGQCTCFDDGGIGEQ